MPLYSNWSSAARHHTILHERSWELRMHNVSSVHGMQHTK
jgi:hypothetical protein